MTQPAKVISLIAGLALAGSAFATPKVGTPAPNFVGQTVDGQPLDLATFRGHVVLVNLWATWCPPCRAEMPMLDAYAKAHQAEGVVMIGLSADRHRDIGDVRKVMSAFSYPAAMLSDAKINEIGSPAALPETLVIDQHGIVRAILINSDRPLTADALNAALGPLQATHG